MDGSGDLPAAEVDIAAAEKLILQWEPTASPARSSSSDRMLFSNGADRDQAGRFLRAVDEIRRSVGADPVTSSPKRLSSSSLSPSPATALQIAMARLEDEFRNILLSQAHDVDIDSLVDLSSLSMSSDRSGDFSDDEAEKEPATPESSSSRRISSCRSARSIREVELFPSEAVDDLRSIAERMIAAGYGRECVQVYSSVRKSAIDLSLRRLGVEKLSIGDVQRLEWDALEAKIRRWIRSARACVRIIFASERRLSELVFDPDEAPFAETVKVRRHPAVRLRRGNQHRTPVAGEDLQDPRPPRRDLGPPPRRCRHLPVRLLRLHQLDLHAGCRDAHQADRSGPGDPIGVRECCPPRAIQDPGPRRHDPPADPLRDELYQFDF
ncbi:exocyst complex component EXO70A1-like [Iris pallida]|uniref:Exocyst complex component EXO70A1-like n=1 Tax=Iris pallida TaxID=29817 RepID=A0AAX6HFS0_IRIPA|nr:exocyst complex component EXO70A1-like [Iris pallida]